MALIECPECKNMVSSNAASCPKCGSPIGSGEYDGELATVQETGKRLKIHMLVSSVIFWISFLILVGTLSVNSANDENWWYSGGAVFVSLSWFMATRIRIWWNHK